MYKYLFGNQLELSDFNNQLFTSANFSQPLKLIAKKTKFALTSQSSVKFPKVFTSKLSVKLSQCNRNKNASSISKRSGKLLRSLCRSIRELGHVYVVYGGDVGMESFGKDFIVCSEY